MESSKIKIAIADDHLLFRQGLVSLLSFSESFQVVLEASNGVELLDRLKNHHVDVLLLDMQMPVMDGTTTLKELNDKFPEVKSLILTMGLQNEQVKKVMNLGAMGILLKDQDFESITEAIETVNNNKYYINERVSSDVVRSIIEGGLMYDTETGPSLSEREIQIIQLICKECTNKEISDRLNISTRTVEGHRERILLKIQAKNVAGIVMYAMKNNILT